MNESKLNELVIKFLEKNFSSSLEMIKTMKEGSIEMSREEEGLLYVVDKNTIITQTYESLIDAYENDHSYQSRLDINALVDAGVKVYGWNKNKETFNTITNKKRSLLSICYYLYKTDPNGFLDLYDQLVLEDPFDDTVYTLLVRNDPEIYLPVLKSLFLPEVNKYFGKKVNEEIIENWIKSKLSKVTESKKLFKNPLLNEQYKVQTEGRTEFSTFETAVLIYTGKWDDDYQCTDKHIYDIDINKKTFTVLFQNNKDFRLSTGLDFEEYHINDITCADSDYFYGDSFMISQEQMEEDFKDGYVFRYFDAENLELIRKYVAMRNPFIKDMEDHTLAAFLTKKGNKFDEDFVNEICAEVATELDQAYLTTYRREIKSTFLDVLKPYGIITEEFGKEYIFQVSNFLVHCVKHKLDKSTLTVSDVFKTIIEKNGIDMDVDPTNLRDYGEYDKEHFDASSVHRGVKDLIEKQTEKWVKENESAKYVETFLSQLDKVGVKPHKMCKTPDQKFKFKVTDFDAETGNFGVNLYDINKNKATKGTMSVQGIINLATMGTLFNKEDMLREQQENSLTFLSDRIRYELLEESKHYEITSDEVTWDMLKNSDKDDLIIIKKRSENMIEYNELWNESCIEGLRSKDGYQKLPLTEALTKFVNERFRYLCNLLGYTIKTVDVMKAIDYDQVDYIYRMKITVNLI